VERSDAVGRTDEWHMYKYKKDGSYSIEIVAHGAGTIVFSKYDKDNKCLEETFSSIETIQYEYDNAGRLKRMLYNEKKEKPVEIALIVYNSEGFIEKIVSTKDPSQGQYFKYNKFGLASEETNVKKNENDKEEKQVIFYEYEFRE
jgi:YD repeat-containing protein